MCWIENKFITKTVIWLAAEILFNFVGIDDLADYSEFVLENNFEKSEFISHFQKITFKSSRTYPQPEDFLAQVQDSHLNMSKYQHFTVMFNNKHESYTKEAETPQSDYLTTLQRKVSDHHLKQLLKQMGLSTRPKPAEVKSGSDRRFCEKYGFLS